jgi:hypothetical protein
MASSRTLEEAWDNILGAFLAIEESARTYGLNSEEKRLAQAAFDQWKEEYLELMARRK